MSVEGSPSRYFRVPQRGWTERLLNAAMVIMLIVPPVMALGWVVVNSILDQF